MWNEACIQPFAPLQINPSALCFHYGQTVFEGMKAFAMSDGSISIFRIDKHFERFNRSLERMCMPPVPFDLFREGLQALVAIDQQWVPKQAGTSMYIRPFVIASQELYGVRVSDEYMFIVFTGPVGAYYSKPLKVKVETKYSRAAHGGTGYAKCGGNYGGSFLPAALAHKEGFDQILWTDLSPELFIEESGTMNVMFVIGDTLVTPALSDSILEGVTRDSLLCIARELGIKVEERRISAVELEDAAKHGILKEAFGTGTAAVTSPIKSIEINGTTYELAVSDKKSLSYKLAEKLNDIRIGKAVDKYSWNTVVKI
jgi:branched-chain amino acid aminotransferase